MIKLALKISILVSIVILLLSQLDKVFFKDHFYRDTINQYKKSNKNFDIVFFGNSHSHSSFDPRIFELTLGAKTINLGSPSQRLVSTKAVIDMVVQKTSPDVALVNIFSLSLNETNNERYKAFQLETLDFLPNSYEKFRVIASMFPVDEWPEAMSKTIRFHYNWENLNSPDIPYPYSRNYDTYKGFATYKTSYDSLAYKKFEKKFGTRDTPKVTLSLTEKKRINDIISIFKEHDIPVLFVNAPDYAYDISENFKTYAIAIGDYLRERKQVMLDFNLIKDSLGLTPLHYRDPNHLNTKGAIIASSFLSNYIDKNYKVTPSLNQKDLRTNRYFHAKNNFEKVLASSTINTKDSLTKGVRNIHLYNAGNNKVEVLFEIDPGDFEMLKVTTQFGSKKDLPISKKYRGWYTFNKEDIISYGEKSFLVATFYPKESKLFDFEIRVNNESPKLLFSFDQLDLVNDRLL